MSEEKLAKAIILLTEDKPEKALKICNKVLAKNPEDNYGIALKGDCLNALKQYDEALTHIANQNIEIDFDDGVKVNYAKFQNIEVSREGKKSKKINLLKKL